MRLDADRQRRAHETDAWGGESLLSCSASASGCPGRRTRASRASAARARSPRRHARMRLPRARRAGRGSRGVTVEGLARRRASCTLCRRLREAGAVQCGFCTPGSSSRPPPSSTNGPAPTDDEIREALSGNLCRCTGYAKIFDAVRAAARGEIVSVVTQRPALERGPRSASSPRPPTHRRRCPGGSRTRAISSRRGCSSADTLRSPHAHARIVSIDIGPGASYAGRPRGAHARGRPRADDVRPRVRRPAGARDRSRPLPRRAGGDRRRRARGAGAAGRCRDLVVDYELLEPVADPGACDRAAARCTPTARPWGTGTATTSVRTSFATW